MQYSPEQPPAHATVPEIVIYLNRTQAMIHTMILAISTVLGAILFFSHISLLFILYSGFQLHTIPTSTVVVLILYDIFTFFVLIFAAWATIWQLVQLSRRTPQLIINHQGITIGKRLLYRGAFIPWQEIDEICVYQTLRTYFGIRPRDTRKFLHHFSAFTRFSMRRSLLFGFPPLYISQAFLERPAQEILKQIEIAYAQEVKMHNIQISS